MKALRTALEALRAAATDLLRRPLFSLLAIAAMALALLVLAGFVLAGQGLRAAYGRVAQEAAIEVYLRPGAEAAQVDDLVRRLAADAAVREVRRIAPEQALAELVRLYPDLGDVRELLGDNPLPSSLRVLPRDPDAAALAGLVRTVRAHPAALSVRYDREWLQTLARAGRAVSTAAAAGALVLLLSALATIGAVVRLALDDRLDEVRLLRLVGAPASFVLTPVLLAGALLGGVGGAVAAALLAAARGALEGWAGAASLAGLLPAALPAAALAGLVAGAALAGAFTAALAAGRAALR